MGSESDARRLAAYELQRRATAKALEEISKRLKPDHHDIAAQDAARRVGELLRYVRADPEDPF